MNAQCNNYNNCIYIAPFIQKNAAQNVSQNEQIGGKQICKHKLM